MGPDNAISNLTALLATSKCTVVFTGAGISTESGIPDFRSPGGVWTKYDPEDFTYQKYISSENTRRRSWQRFRESGILGSDPNPAHYALAELESLGKLQCLITQNVDGLHQKAGSSPDRVIELHGTYHTTRCLNCGAEYPSIEILAQLELGAETPPCERCGGVLKVAAISFGQAMPEREVEEAERWSRAAELFLVIGSSLVVYPAAELPFLALRAGAKLTVINLSETPVDHLAAVVIREKAGEVLPKVVEALKGQPAG